MAELTVPPLLAHTPEVSPPWRGRVLLLMGILAVVGILIATACAISGQDTQRESYTLQMQADYARAETALAQAELRHAPPGDIEKLQSDLDKERRRKLPSYAEYGRHFTQWDGYRYEEIITDGYLYHHPYDPESLKDSSTMIPAGSTEPRLKNIVWYPLYPIVGAAVSRILHIAPVAALTVVSQTCVVLASVILFLYARRHYYNRLPKLNPAPRLVPGFIVDRGIEPVVKSHPPFPEPRTALVGRPSDAQVGSFPCRTTAALWACACISLRPLQHLPVRQFQRKPLRPAPLRVPLLPAGAMVVAR